MKIKFSVVMKQIISMMTSIAKAKSMAIKNKISAAKSRLIMFSLMKNKKFLLNSMSQKIHNLFGQHEEESELLLEVVGDHESKAIVLHNNAIANESQPSRVQYLTYRDKYEYADDDDDDDDSKYPDLRHSLFDKEEDFEDLKSGESVIDMVKNSKEEEGEKFNLEDEIDHVADLFINRFHKQMRFQKLLSFKRFQEMLERSA